MQMQQDNGKLHLGALVLIPDVMFTELMYNTSDAVLRKEKASKAVQEVRDALAIVEEVVDAATRAWSTCITQKLSGWSDLQYI